ncbi:ArnT family glycosyltransferase [Thermodesulfobacteriota bacterium]
MTISAFIIFSAFVAAIAILVIQRVQRFHLVILLSLIAIFWVRMIYMWPGDDDLDLIMLYPPVYSLERIFDPTQYYQEFRPMLHFVNFMLASIFGREYIGWKIASLFFHFINTLLVYRIATSFLHSEKVCLAAAAIYTVHPAPAWEIMQAGNTYMVTFFFLVSFITFVWSFEKKAKTGWYALSVAAFTTGLFFKASMLMMCLVIPCYLLFYVTPSRFFRKGLKLLPYAVIAIGYLLLKITWETKFDKVAEGGIGLGPHMFTQFMDYLALIVFPKLHPITQENWANIIAFDAYAHFPIRYPFTFFPIEGLHGLLRLGSLAVLIALFITGERRERFFLLWIPATLIIYLALIDDVGSHYTRLPVAGFAIILAQTGRRLYHYSSRFRKPAVLGTILMLLFGFYWIQAYRVTNLYYVEGVITAAKSEGREENYNFSEITNIQAVRDLHRRLRPEFLSFVNEEAAKRPYIGVMAED